MNIITAVGYHDGFRPHIFEQVEVEDLNTDLAQWGEEHRFSGCEDWWVYQYDSDVLSTEDFRKFIHDGTEEFCEGCFLWYIFRK